MGTNTEYCLTAEQIAELLHDLRAPVSNARGFKSELIEAVEQLSTAISMIGPELSDEQRDNLNNIISDDILVCTNLIATSVDTLQDRVKKFEQLFPAYHT